MAHYYVVTVIALVRLLLYSLEVSLGPDSLISIRDFPRPDSMPNISPFPIQNGAKTSKMVYIIPNFLVLHLLKISWKREQK